MEHQPAATTKPTAAATGGVSVVIPVYNERDWITRSVQRVVDELRRAGWDDSEVIVVDDGSTDGTGEVVEELARRHGVRVLHQPNGGRFAARRAGLDAARRDWVLFVDSRVLLEPGSLAFLRSSVHGGAQVWNGHVDVNVVGKPFARFWDAVAKAAWSAYFANPRTTSYGTEDFDRYPKGTGCFFAPRDAMLDAYQRFRTYFEDTRSSNDDTSLIRELAASHRIWLSPGFRCRYEGRSSLREFVRHAHNRGVFFVDGHLRRESAFAPVVVAFYPASVLAVAAFLYDWWVPPALLLASGAAAGLVGAARGLRGADLVALGGVTPLFVITYGLGMWRGLALLAMRKVKRS